MVDRMRGHSNGDTPLEREAWLEIIRQSLALGAEVSVRVKFPTGIKVVIAIPADDEEPPVN